MGVTTMKKDSCFDVFPESNKRVNQFAAKRPSSRMKIGLFAFNLLFLLQVVNVDGEVKRPLLPDDAIRVVRIGDVLITPDGEKVFYSESHLNWEKNTYKKTYFMVPFTGGTPREFIGKDGGKDFQFSPDGKHLSLLRDIDKNSQLFIMPITGGEALQVTSHRGGIEEYKWSRDCRKIFFTAKDVLDKKQQEQWEKGADAYYVDEGPHGKSAGKWRNLWVYDLKSKEEIRLTEEKFVIHDFELSPDGKYVALAARPNNRQNYPHLSELYLFDLEKKDLTRLTNNMAPESDIKWSPEGKTFLYRAPDDKEFELHNGFFWVMNPKTREIRKLNAQNQGEVDHVVWMPDGKSILFNEVRGTNVNLFRLDTENDKITPLTDKIGTLRALAFSENRQKMVYSFSDFNKPADIYASDLSSYNAVRLTRANTWIEEEKQLGKGEVLRWKSSDGIEIEGIFIFPVDFKQGEEAPLILDIHGGPSGYFGNEFDTFFQLYSGLGYAVLGVNVRGSSGYGDEILRGLMGDVGGGEFEDLMSGVDHVIELGYVDPEHMGVKGWSWGGVSCGWVVTHTDRFKAASCGAGVFSWQAESGPGFNFDVSLWYIGGNAWENPEEWRKRSALTYVKNVKTPTLLLHGSLDTTSSMNQSMIFYTALRDLGVPTRFMKFPRQAHGVREPRLRRILMIEEIKWMQKHIFGLEWTPPKKVENSSVK
jgi:dipeptidyl aminopeptidase/acylaminoacyl peptidase